MDATLTSFGKSGSLIVLDFKGFNLSSSSLTVKFPRGIKTVIRSNPSTGLYSGWQAKDDRYNVWHKVTLSVEDIDALKERFNLIGIKNDQGTISSTYFSKGEPYPWEVLVSQHDCIDVKKLKSLNVIE
jgi:hypothetical protein